MSIYFLGLSKELLAIHEAFEKRANKPETGMIKQAFDTRRMNSETQINPRRNLQNYQRSESFITDEISSNIKLFFKVKSAADQIKEEFIGDPDWLDSNSRILCNAIDNTLRVEQKDYDFFKPQFDYLNELLYLRYRLASDEIERLNETEIKNAILKRDERLLYKSVYSKYQPKNGIEKTTSTVSQPDQLMDKLFAGVKATQENKNIKRSVNITIEDSIIDGENTEIKKGV